MTPPCIINLGHALEPTGKMTLELRSAIRAFQHRSGLEVTGRLDVATLQKLEALHGS
ncbi:peptidoglycan-binding domain-containing protein [Pyxidicoccus xibeiensis]|uniref:peptidoglycan-binding domain-containing protein n=1 Tax=Pyxidicoccus xibeiensis TaxID=2906759 RepID=UPI0020A7C16A|nr:peptidoglycan-binding domain-containing protein [Pyxidicoccus xibeiensis]MCP3136405.1 peptidoglycan-binding protein [Pyxidicoccus xibeiensis]